MMITTMLVSYTTMRHKGFHFTPFGAKKLPAVGGILLAGWIGHIVGLKYSRSMLGNRAQYRHLKANRSAIKKGTMSFDAPQSQ